MVAGSEVILSILSISVFFIKLQFRQQFFNFEELAICLNHDFSLFIVFQPRSRRLRRLLD